MATDPSELDAFIEFARPKFENGNTPPSLEDALREFREHQAAWEPRTPLGHQLKSLRQQFVDSGGKLLTPDEVEDEVKSRRGPHFSED